MSISKITSSADYYPSSAHATVKSSAAQNAAENMTMGEYKQYIYSKISDIQKNKFDFKHSTSVSISEDGFKAMKNDPDYENWVFNQIENSFTNSVGNEASLTVLRIGAGKRDLAVEVWVEEKYNKKKLSEKIEEDYQRKCRLRKKLMAKNEHYAQYRKVLMENSLQKAKIESEHIKGNFDDLQSSKNLNAIASYRAILNSTSTANSATTKSGTESESLSNTQSDTKNNEVYNKKEYSTTVTFNAEKRARQLASAKTPEQIKVLLNILNTDLSECREGLRNGWCDENEVAKVESMIRKAKEKQSKVSADDSAENENPDMSFYLNMIM